MKISRSIYYSLVSKKFIFSGQLIASIAETFVLNKNDQKIFTFLLFMILLNSNKCPSQVKSIMIFKFLMQALMSTPNS